MGCAVMDWIVVAEDTDRWDVWLWTGSRRLRVRTGGMCGYGLDRGGSGYGQVGCAVMDLIEVAQDTSGGMCGYGQDRAGSGYGQVGCAFLDWIELALDTDRWDVLLWTGSRWLSVRTGGMCGYELDGNG